MFIIQPQINSTYKLHISLFLSTKEFKQIDACNVKCTLALILTILFQLVLQFAYQGGFDFVKKHFEAEELDVVVSVCSVLPLYVIL